MFLNEGLLEALAISRPLLAPSQSTRLTSALSDRFEEEQTDPNDHSLQ